MNFTHLIEINDPLNPLIDPLSRAQLWRGLVLRAESPDLFVPYLDAYEILERSDTTLSRELRYGTLTVRDEVVFSPLQRVHYQVPAQGEIPPSSLIMEIEEPQPDIFFVRFTYDDGVVDEEGSIEAYYNEYRRSAYQESDIDTIGVIRQLATDGKL
ncbi:MAG: SRPBCC family protein [Burkholderiaceae bacterium]